MSSFGACQPVEAPRDRAASEWVAGQLALALPTFPQTCSCAEAYEIFLGDETRVAAAVVDEDGRPVGLVNRLLFMARYAQRYIPEIYGRRAIVGLVNVNPFVVDEHVPVSELASMIALDHAEALRECFVVTREGRYLGIGTSEALVRAKLALLSLRERQLREALLSARESCQTKSNFLALMSHELRTPLNAIIGFAEVLSSEMFGPHATPRYGEYAGDIHRAGKHLLALINDILDLSKADAGKLELLREPVALPGLCDECVRLVIERARGQHQKLVVRMQPDLPSLEADRLRLKQVLLNLLSNAVKFTPAGGEIELSAHRGGDGGIVIRVRDTGIGMAPDDIAVALEPFRQIASPLAREREGTGLGLTLVKSLTEKMDGRLAITSAVNEGTTVQLGFPSCRVVENIQ